MKMGHARRAFGLAIIVAISDLLSGYVAEAFGLKQHWWPILIGSGIAVLLLFVLEKYSPLRLIKPLRRRFYGEVSSYEGFWISDVSHADRPYSISKIYYSKSRASWICRGYAFSDDFKIIASWIGQSIHFDPESSYWFFKGSWWRHHPGSIHHYGPAMDQFFKYQTNRGENNKLSGIIIDNTEMAGNKDLHTKDRTEVLTSVVRRISREDFLKKIRMTPRRIEDVAAFTHEDFEKLIREFVIGAEQHTMGFGR